MNKRIKKLRKTLDLTQQEFADRIGSKRTTIAKYETDTNIPSSAIVSLICREFNVNETWLRTGEGEMFVPQPEFDLVGYIAQHKMSEMETEILKAYLELAPNVREGLIQHFKERLAAKPDTTGQERTQLDTTVHERTEPDLAAKVAELERQNQEKDRQLQELADKVAAMEEEDALLGLADGFSISHTESAGNLRTKK